MPRPRGGGGLSVSAMVVGLLAMKIITAHIPVDTRMDCRDADSERNSY